MKRKIIIIGGSKGIGNAIIKTLLPSFYVVNLSRTAPELQHEDLEHHTVDILNDDLPDIEQADALIYCPGSINLKPIARLKLEDFSNDFNINVIGAVKSIQKYLPALKNGSAPSITLFSTVATKLGMPFHSSVAASKSAIEGLAKSLAAELAPTVRVNVIAPTVTNTTLAAKLLRNEKSMEMMRERHPMKKYLEPQEVASLASYLVSEDAQAITGQVFNLDAGIVHVKI
ncbi:MAG: SDR family NAD(P)-dependent oxidoreductase [bacterium]